MSLLNTQMISCPSCGETFEIVVDCSISSQEYVEDCFVCCRPIKLHVEIDSDQHIRISAQQENE